jgi:hypothetical protein
MNDFRGHMWNAAYLRLEWAEKLRTEMPCGEDPLPELYWANMFEASICAQLASADLQPAIIAGAAIQDRAEQEQERQAVNRAAMEEVLNSVKKAKGKK